MLWKRNSTEKKIVDRECTLADWRKNKTDTFCYSCDLKINELRRSKILWKFLKKTFRNSIFCPKIQLWQNPNIFTSFSPNFFTIFLVKSKLSTAKKSKTTTFSRVFHPKKKSTIFSGNQSWIFVQKMKIFEQCVKHAFHADDKCEWTMMISNQKNWFFVA